MKSFDGTPSTLRVWLVALRPFSFSASVLPVLLGMVIAWEAGFLMDVWPGGLLLASVLLLHASANLLNDYFDFMRGVDRDVLPVSGAIVRGWLPASRILLVARVLLGLGTAAAAWLVAMRGWPVALLGGGGLLLAWGYTREGFCLKYAGLGDVTIFLAFGVLPVLTGWFVQTDAFALSPLWWSAAPGLLAVSILHANNWRDIDRDSANGCNTLAVRIGSRRCRVYWVGLLAAVIAFWLLSPFFAFYGLGIRVPVWTALPLLTLPEFITLARKDWAAEAGRMAALDARVARLHMFFTALLCLGFVLAKAVR
jgi:1,4-dihydroxy-2-naphthoate polyprenyltransferase